MTHFRITIERYAYGRHAREGGGMEEGMEYQVMAYRADGSAATPPNFRYATLGEALEVVKVLAEGMEKTP